MNRRRSSLLLSSFQKSDSSFLRLVYALASKTVSKSLSQWLETATMEDLKLVFPVLLNWSFLQWKLPPSADHQNIMEMVSKILQLTKATTEKRVGQGDTEARMSRLSLSGYFRANGSIFESVPILKEMVHDHKNAVFDLSDEPLAANTLEMVNRRLLPGDACQQFIDNSTPVLHPFTGEPCSTMAVLKVFDTSKTKPAWIRYFRDTDRVPILPDAIAKQGDDLRNDQAIRFIAKLCNALWALAPVDWKLGMPPTVFAYDVLVTSANSGYLQHVPGKTFFELNQKIAACNNIPSKLTNGDGGGKDDNGDEIGWDHVNLEQLAPSLVGSYVANFILGTRDRHEHNMMVVGDLKKDPKLMQIDFGYILMEYPGGVHFDTPRLTMPVPLIDRLNDADGIDGFSSLMEHLQQDMLAAYLVLRRHAVELIHFCQVILSPTHDPNAVESFLRGSHSLRTHESEKASSNYFSRKIETQFSRFVFRREVRQHMVASYYTFHRGMEFSKYFRSRSKRRLLMTRAAEALKIALPTETPEDKVDITRRKCLSRSLSANDLPSMDGSQTSRRFADCQSGGHHKGQNIWSRDEWDSSIGEDSDTEEYFSAQSEPEFL